MLFRSHKLSLWISLLIIAGLLVAACQPAAAPTTAAPEPTEPPPTEPAEEPTEAATEEPTEEAAPTGPIKIAIMGPFTGDAASIGTEQLNFARLAVADFNQEMGTNVELVESDTQLDPAIAQTVAEQLVADEEVLAVIGPAGSQEVEAVAALFQENSLAHVSASATRPSLTQQGWETFFRVVPNDDVQGPTDASFIIDVLQATNVYIIDDQSTYSVSLADIVEQQLTDAGVTVGRDSVSQDDTDFSALVTNIGSAGATVVFFPGQIASQGALLWRQLQEQGVEATVMGGDGFNSPDLVADGANEGSYVSNFAPDIHGVPNAADVAAAYEEQYGEFGAFGPPAYVATQVVLQAIDRAMKSGELTRDAVLAEIPNTDIAESILGSPIRFDENGDVEGAQFYIFQVQDGAFALVQE